MALSNASASTISAIVFISTVCTRSLAFVQRPAAAFPRSSTLSIIATSTTSSNTTNNIANADAVPSVPIPPWYSDPDLLRDRAHVVPVDRGFDYQPNSDDDDDDGDSISTSSKLDQTMLDVLSRPTSRIVPFQGSSVYVRRLEGENSSMRGAVEPLFLRYDECDPSWFRTHEGAISWLGQQSTADEGDDDDIAEGEEKLDYFAIDIPSDIDTATSAILNTDGIESSTVRNYGDTMPSRAHAALLATANGLLTFHRTHRYCSKCGSFTAQIKAGSARKCTNKSCKTSVYPRIDPAVIMLITSPCRNYALLGRKGSWPCGRYSTLAGFAEVGETLEKCVVRETLEESGVNVDPKSIRFVASQPWPFPRSMMVGFHATAIGDIGEGDTLPKVQVDPAELEDAQWFDREYVRKNGLVEGRGSSALDFDPDEDEAEFHIPGPASLARLLITDWVVDGKLKK